MLNIIELIALRFLYLSNMVDSDRRADLVVKAIGWVFFFLIYLFLAALVFIAARRLSLVAASRGHSLLRCAGLSLRWPLLLRSTGSRRTGFSSCVTKAQ